MWMMHSGGFYYVKKQMLEPGEMPEPMHAFKWQNFSTWASGILLLIVVYYMGTSAYLVEPGSGIPAFSVALSVALGSLFGGWVLYDTIWRSPIRDRDRLASAICVVALFAITYGLAQFLSPRAAYIHVGVLMGTVMTGNVWMVIIPSQRDLVEATKSGKPQDRMLAYRAKQRSIHNNYMTFPLIFIMVSNHYPQTYSHRLGWAILIVLMIGSALVRHFMNTRWSFPAWRPAMAASGVATIAAMYLLMGRPQNVSVNEAELASGPPIAFTDVQAIVANRCVACHSKTPYDPSFSAPPAGIMFDAPEQIAGAADRIRVRVESGTMPFANRTQMTDAERDTVIRWVAQGAPYP
jgi:uncharacterized membrane protein